MGRGPAALNELPPRDGRSVGVRDSGPGGSGAHKVEATIPGGKSPSSVAIGEDGVWVTNALSNSVMRIDPASNHVSATVPLSGQPSSVAVGNGFVWATSQGGSLGTSVSKIDPATDPVAAVSNQVVRVIIVGGAPTAVSVGLGAVWVAVRAS
jgi:YVTN family beta-propeller protein